jgi:hypothetical protein
MVTCNTVTPAKGNIKTNLPKCLTILQDLRPSLALLSIVTFYWNFCVWGGGGLDTLLWQRLNLVEINL